MPELAQHIPILAWLALTLTGCGPAAAPEPMPPKAPQVRQAMAAPAVAAAETPPEPPRGPTKVAVVDFERAVVETTEGQRLQSTLKKLFESKHAELNKQQEALNKERDSIDKQRHTLSEAALAQRAEKWQRDAAQLQQRFTEYNQELQRKETELTSPLFQKAMSIIRRLASQEGIDVVVDRKAAPHIRGDLDLTDRVIQMHNAGAGGDAAPAPAAPKAPAPTTPRVAPSKP